ncbi:uncharacterized protein K452DRAFT_164416 [Aplosporella prunicola CBS 121167]|uniref:Peptidase M20 domain-containing protein 2 n=1 Tax=Aplosporella prunicola CBS 121167 TaxID=1176127 RepID=A0A6A6BN17_9PEZI|nr:uncharacterized protein K452DRAFT_164416 [Aplosporella prunicola CBS 121167]KAF2143941.1 hypothetical protein K452DRAFT_164416 [Aplosporella prunicola CBS 121167]
MTQNEHLEHSIADVRNTIHESIDALESELRAFNKSIHSHPETAYQEVFAHDTLCAFLEKQGFTVIRHAYGLDTSFEAEIGSGDKLVIFCCEYDALPGIGHACGHNLIATSSLAAFIGTARAVHKFGVPGKVRILGTPAEEGGGGKIQLLKAGAFEGDVVAAIMAHPTGGELHPSGYSGLGGFKLIASHKFRVEFSGKTAHAGAEPWKGHNALDAAVSGYNNVSMLRQQIQPDERIHGVIEDGGKVPNVIPDYTRMNWYVRSPTTKRANDLLQRVKACLQAAATATGCTLNYIDGPFYKNLRVNRTLSQYYADDMAELGENVLAMHDEPGTASTDMGNVSWAVPSFHGGFGISAPPGVSAHHPAFAEAASKDSAHEAAIKAAKGMALLGWRALTDTKVSEGAKKNFEDEE